MKLRIMLIAVLAVIVAGGIWRHKILSAPIIPPRPPILPVVAKIDKEGQPATAKFNLIGPVKSVYVTRASASDSGDYGKPLPQIALTFNTDGNLLEDVSFYPDGRQKSRLVFAYDDYGRSSGYTRYRDGKVIEKLVQKVGEYGIVYEQRRYDATGQIVGSVSFSYEGNGQSRHIDTQGKERICERIGCDKSGRAMHHTISNVTTGTFTNYRYDPSGKSVDVTTSSDKDPSHYGHVKATELRDGIETITYGNNGEPRLRKVKRYNSRWDPIEESIYDGDGKTIVRILKRYNSHHDVCSETVTGPGEDKRSIYSDTYVYDSYGNWTECKQTIVEKNGKPASGPVEVVKRKITYFE